MGKLKLGYKSETGSVCLAIGTAVVLPFLSKKLMAAVVPLWALVSRLVARGARNRARLPTVKSPEKETQKARVVMRREMTLKERPLAVVTGTNSGIGYHTAVGLAVEGFITVVTCRSAALAAKTADRIRDEAEKKRRLHPKKYQDYPETVMVEGQVLECDNFATIRQFVEWFNRKYDQHNFQVLVNNAGGMSERLTFSKHDPRLELHTAVNFLGPLLLTHSLLPLLEKNGGRVVYVSSEAHRLPQGLFEGVRGIWKSDKGKACGMVKGRLLEALRLLNQGKQKATGPLTKDSFGSAFVRYGTSKLLNTYDAHVIARQYRNKTGNEEKNRVYACSLHPGCVSSNFPQYLRYVPGMMTLYKTAGLLFLKSPEEGAQTTLHCALCPREELELVSPIGNASDDAKVSRYFVECRDKTESMLLAYGWDVKEAEAIIQWGLEVVGKS